MEAISIYSIIWEDYNHDRYRFSLKRNPIEYLWLYKRKVCSTLIYTQIIQNTSRERERERGETKANIKYGECHELCVIDSRQSL